MSDLVDDRPNAAPSGLRVIVANMGWLAAGKGFGAVCSLVYLAILARSLGLKDFGHFSLIFGTGQALVAFVGFQTWQTVVRFGAAPLEAGDQRGFGQLAILCGLIDAFGAMSGCLIAGLIYFYFAEALGLNPALVHMAFAFNCALLWARTSAANGIVRVLNRFDVATYVEAMVPIGRLLAAAAIWAIGPSVGAFLAAWAIIDLAAGAAYWMAARRLAPDALRFSNFGGFRSTVQAHPGIIRFLGITYATSGLDSMLKHGPLLAVAYFLNTSAAGLYRLADQLAQGLGKLAALLARAIYAEIARAQVAISAKHFRKLVAQVSAAAALAGTIISLVSLFAGRQLLHAIGGEVYAAGHPILVALSIGASLELAAIPYEPVLHSAGRADLSLWAKVSSLAAVICAGAVLIGYESTGIAWSVSIGYLASFLVFTSTSWWVLARGSGNR